MKAVGKVLLHKYSISCTGGTGRLVFVTSSNSDARIHTALLRVLSLYSYCHATKNEALACSCENLPKAIVVILLSFCTS
jgi:hypothetical protein